jgi:hypothetical protein
LRDAQGGVTAEFTQEGDSPMLTREQAEEILLALSRLPSDRIAEVRDFILYLRDRYGHRREVDENDAWTGEDVRDLAAAVLNRAEQTLWAETESDG